MQPHRLIVHLTALFLASLPALLMPTRSHAQAGSLDTGFDPGTTLNNKALALVAQPDGKVLVGGDFAVASSRGALRYVTRLNADGSLDTGFNPARGASLVGSGLNNEVKAVALQPDGKILIGGLFSQINTESHLGLARLNPDGSLDRGFAPVPDSGIPVGAVNAIAVQADGRIVIGGVFLMVNGTPRNSIARLNADGSLDAGFDPGSGAGEFVPVNAVAVQEDNKVVLAGGFTAINGTARRGVARLNADGSLDAGFDPGSVVGLLGVNAVAVQPDGKVVLGGNSVVRVNRDGSVDASFDFGAGANSPVQALVVQPDGKIVLGGSFTTVNGMPSAGVSRLNADGSLDAGFSPGALSGGLFTTVNALALRSDNRILLGGDFTSVGGATRNYVARLNNTTPGPVVPAFFAGAADVGGGFSYLSSFGYFKLLPDNPGYVFHNDLGFLYFIDANDGKGGIYFYDFATTPGAKGLGFLYTAPGFPFPYLYSFDLGAFLYYFPDTKRGNGFYTTGPRVFNRLDTGEFLFR